MRGGWEESRLRDHGHLVTAARGTETPNTKVQMKLAVYSDPLDRAITQSYGSEVTSWICALGPRVLEVS